MHPLATELDAHLTPSVRALLSRRGREIYFPSKGILGQAAEAKGAAINATIGIALEEDGSPMRLPGLEERVALPPGDVFTYAPSYGKPALRERWRRMIRDKNPALSADTPISLPVVTNALTHALSVAGYLFLDEGDPLILPDLYWGNYRLIYENAFGARLATFPTFTDRGTFDVDGLRKALGGEPGKRVVLLNFPNNPTGYTPDPDCAKAICDALVDACERGCDVAVLIDDAYFGLVYEEGVFTESIFTLLADAHPRLLAVKIDGPTKEDYVWGYRVGFVTYAIAGGDAGLYRALEDKTAGAVRGAISNASHLGQSLLLAVYDDPRYPEWKAEKKATLTRRYREVRRILDDNPRYREHFEALPFNSGYFMCVRPTKAAPEAVRRALLAEHSTGVIATGDLIRLAFSSTPHAQLADLFAHLYAACDAVAGSGSTERADT